jgi:hypothetical protein
MWLNEIKHNYNLWLSFLSVTNKVIQWRNWQSCVQAMLTFMELKKRSLLWSQDLDTKIVPNKKKSRSFHGIFYFPLQCHQLTLNDMWIHSILYNSQVDNAGKWKKFILIFKHYIIIHYQFGMVLQCCLFISYSQLENHIKTSLEPFLMS